MHKYTNNIYQHTHTHTMIPAVPDSYSIACMHRMQSKWRACRFSSISVVSMHFICKCLNSFTVHVCCLLCVICSFNACASLGSIVHALHVLCECVYCFFLGGVRVLVRARESGLSFARAHTQVSAAGGQLTLEGYYFHLHCIPLSTLKGFSGLISCFPTFNLPP